MGDPVDCASDAGLINGTFDVQPPWLVNNGWGVAGGVASVIWTETIGDVNLWQFIDLNPDEIYLIEFDILVANCPYRSGLRVRLGGVEAEESILFQTVGHKAVLLSPTLADRWILFFIWATQFFPGEVVIDNVIIKKIDQIIACDYGFLPMEGTKSETLVVDANTNNITLAHWNGKSNVLIEIKK